MEPPSSMELKVMSCNEDPKEKQKKRNHDKQKTPIDREGDGDPEWKHDIRFDLKQILSSSALTSLDHMFVHFDILAEGFLGDKSVGQVVVPLKELILESHGGGATRFISYQVRGSDGKPNGTLNFSYKVVGNEISSTFQNNNNNPAIVYPPVQAVAPPPSISYPPIDNYPSSPPMFYPPPIEVQHQHHHHHNPSTSSEVFYTAPPTPASPHTPTVSVADMFPYPPPQQHQLPLHYQPPPPAPAFPYGYGSGGFGYPHQPGFYPMTTIGYPHPNPYPYVDRPYGDTWHRENQHGGGSPGGSWRRIRKLFGRLKKRFR